MASLSSRPHAAVANEPSVEARTYRAVTGVIDPRWNVRTSREPVGHEHVVASRNPYFPGAGLRPAELVGRDAQIKELGILRACARQWRISQSIVLTGLRGVGKTVLLNELAQVAPSDEWTVAKVEAESDTSRTPFRNQVAAALNVSLRQIQGKNVNGPLRDRALRTFKSFSFTPAPKRVVERRDRA